MTRRHTISTRTDTLCPITTLFRSAVLIDGTRFDDQVRLVAPNVLVDDPGAHRDALAGDRWIEVLGIVPRVGHAQLLPVLAIEQICRMRSEEHTSELQSLMRISYAVFCLKKKNKKH